MAAVIFLYGPPASGKTTLGRRLAQQRQLEFVDLDEEIMRREGRSVSAIFAAEGEAGFRERESSVLRAVIAAVKRPSVIALGGGTLLREENRQLCEQTGEVYCLATPPAAELTRRLALAADHRPLGDRSAERAAHYASFRPFTLG